MKATLTFKLDPNETAEDVENKLVDVEFDMNDPDVEKMIKRLAKVKLEYDMDDYEYDDKADFIRAVKASNAYAALWDITQELFRPAFKHGYSDKEIEDIITKCGEYDDPEWDGCKGSNGIDLIDKLNKLFWNILEKNGVNLDEEYF